MGAGSGGLSARTGIRSQDQLEPCREAGVHLASPKRDHARLQGRTERMDDSRLKLRCLVQKENPSVSQSVIRFYELDIV